MSSYSIASEQTMIYLGIPICFAGVIGGLLNVVVFLSFQTFRENSCAFYLTAMSFLNIGELITGLFPRIMMSGFDIDWTQTSLFYCKFRWFFVQLCLLTTFTCLCLATIDQYCATCLNPRWRQYSNIKLARRLCVIFAFIWFLHGIPFLFYQNHIKSSDTNIIICKITNPIFQQYFIYCYVLILSGFLSTTIAVIFGFLAYRNIQQLSFQTIPIARRELDKQLTTMVLVQVIFNFFVVIPYMIVSILLFDPKVLIQPIVRPQLSLALTITVCLYYLYFSSPFYIYICVSERFRRQLKYVFFDIYITRWRQRITVVNEITPQT